MKICFIGLGNMGLPMAQRLAASFDVAGWDISGGARDRFWGSVADLGPALASADGRGVDVARGGHMSRPSTESRCSRPSRPGRC